MVPMNLVVAAALLTAPPGNLDLTDSAALHATYGSTVKLLALHWEVLDPHEVHMLAKPQDFAGDLKILQGRYQELAGAPLLEECARFPRRALVNDLVAFNRAYQKDLEARLPLDRLHEQDIQATLDENERLFQVWDAVREARCEYYYVTVRRQALQQLRDRIGMEAFYSGRLPPHVPMWRFTQE